MKAKRVYTYSDPLNDDFAGTNIKTCHVGKEFCYIRTSLLWRVASFLVYYIIALPIVWLVAKLYLGLKFENRSALRKLHGKGFFLYGNHTQILDAFIPPLAVFPKRSYIIAGPDVVSIPGIKHLVMMLGALPIPTYLPALRGLLNAISVRCSQCACIAVYPETHIWPFYTGIRPFPDTAFRYPVSENAPAIAMVTTYRKRKGLFRFFKRPGMTVSFSEAMFPDPSLAPRVAQAELRNRVFTFMETTAGEKNQVCYVRYEYVPKKEEIK